MSKQSNSCVAKFFDDIILPKDFPLIMGSNSPSTKPATFVHRHDCLELGYCHKGSGIFMVDDKILTFFAGDVSVITEHEFHIAQSASNSPSLWTFISLNPMELFHQYQFSGMGHFADKKFPNILTEQNHSDIITLVREMISELEQKQPGYHEAVRGIMLAVINKLSRIGSKINHSENLHTRQAIERIAPSLNHIHANYMKTIRISMLAKLCHLSEPHFRRLFASATNKKPQEYLTHLRINMAGILLKDHSRQILDIAISTGYPSLSSFNRHFKRIMGCAPREWRMH